MLWPMLVCLLGGVALWGGLVVWSIRHDRWPRK